MTEQQTIAGELAVLSPVTAIINASITEFAKLLPPSLPPEKFARWGLSVLRAGVNPGTTEQQRKTAEQWARVLAPGNEAGRLSVMSALMDCASLGLEPGREYHLVPFGGTVSGITDYKGEVRLITNARKDTLVVAQLVRAGDQFEFHGPHCFPEYRGMPFSDAEVEGGYAFTLTAGELSSMVITMGRAEFDKHEARGGPIWKQWRDAMQRKTLVHQVRKLVPWSPERQW